MIENITAQIAQFNPVLANAIASNTWLLPLMIIEIIAEIVLYPIALYLSAKRGQKAWFIILFICFFLLNDFGLLAALYIIFNREKPGRTRTQRTTKKK